MHKILNRINPLFEPFDILARRKMHLKCIVAAGAGAGGGDDICWNALTFSHSCRFVCRRFGSILILETFSWTVRIGTQMVLLSKSDCYAPFAPIWMESIKMCICKLIVIVSFRLSISLSCRLCPSVDGRFCEKDCRIALYGHQTMDENVLFSFTSSRYPPSGQCLNEKIIMSVVHLIVVAIFGPGYRCIYASVGWDRRHRHRHRHLRKRKLHFSLFPRQTANNDNQMNASKIEEKRRPITKQPTTTKLTTMEQKGRFQIDLRFGSLQYGNERRRRKKTIFFLFFFLGFPFFSFFFASLLLN